MMPKLTASPFNAFQTMEHPDELLGKAKLCEKRLHDHISVKLFVVEKGEKLFEETNERSGL
jgi:hypothetical protein